MGSRNLVKLTVVNSNPLNNSLSNTLRLSSKLFHASDFIIPEVIAMRRQVCVEFLPRKHFVGIYDAKESNASKCFIYFTVALLQLQPFKCMILKNNIESTNYIAEEK